MPNSSSPAVLREQRARAPEVGFEVDFFLAEPTVVPKEVELETNLSCSGMSVHRKRWQTAVGAIFPFAGPTCNCRRLRRQAEAADDA